MKNNFFLIFNRLLGFYTLIKTHVWYKLFFKKIGSRTRIFKPILISNPENIKLGKNILIRQGARLEIVGSGEIEIGDNCNFEQNLHLTCGEKIIIGRNVTVTCQVMITDIDHNYSEIDTPILSQKNIVKPTSVGDYCFIGAGARIQAGTSLGKQCIVGANAVVRGDFPDYCVIVGVPAKIIKRYDSGQKIWRKTDKIGNFL